MKNLTGANITEWTKGFIPESIRWWMRMWRKIKYHKSGVLYPRAYGNHAAKIINQDEDNWWWVKVIEAVGKGVKSKWIDIREWENIKVFIPIKPYTVSECKKLQDAAKTIENRRYQYTAFFSWMIYVSTFGTVNTFPKGEDADLQFNCYEVVGWMSNYVRTGEFKKNAQLVDIHDIESHPDYKEGKI